MLPPSSSSWFRTRTMGSKDPCAAVTPRRNARERIGHVCPTAFRHADPTRFFADWIPGPIPWPITADRLADGARVELAGGFRPNSLSRTAPLPHGPPSHAGVCDSGAHRPNLDRARMGRFMRDSRSGEDSNLRGLAPLLLSGQSHSTALPPLHRSARRNKLVDVFVWISCSRWDSNPRP